MLCTFITCPAANIPVRGNLLDFGCFDIPQPGICGYTPLNVVPPAASTFSTLLILPYFSPSLFILFQTSIFRYSFPLSPLVLFFALVFLYDFPPITSFSPSPLPPLTSPPTCPSGNHSVPVYTLTLVHCQASHHQLNEPRKSCPARSKSPGTTTTRRRPNLHALPRHNAIRATTLIIPQLQALRPHKPPLPIDLQTPKNILRKRNPAIIRRCSQITNMNPAASAASTGTSLITRAARTTTMFLRRGREEASSPGSQRRARRGCEGRGLGLHPWVAGRVAA